MTGRVSTYVYDALAASFFPRDLNRQILSALRGKGRLEVCPTGNKGHVRFVWYTGVGRDLLPKDEEVLEGALKHHMEPRFVAVEQREFGGVVGASEGGSDAVQGAGGGVGRRDGVEEPVFDGPGAAHAPEGGDHFFDHADFDGVEGTETIEIGGEEGLKGLIGFVV